MEKYQVKYLWKNLTHKTFETKNPFTFWGNIFVYVYSVLKLFKKSYKVI